MSATIGMTVDKATISLAGLYNDLYCKRSPEVGWIISCFERTRSSDVDNFITAIINNKTVVLSVIPITPLSFIV